MSTSRGSGAAGNGGAVQSIPAGSRKMVQSLKEVVPYTEAEIYATLKECNMDPNETVSRLLSQDPFHEVRSKREKKKEVKDTSEPRSRGGGNNNSSRSGKSGADRYLSRGGSTPYNSSESGKISYKKENVSSAYASSLSSVPAVSGNNRSRVSSGHSNGATAENKGSSVEAAQATPSGAQAASAYQSAWAGAPGQVSLADIVKMGRPQNKASNTPTASHHNVQAQQIPTNEDWPIMPPATKVVSLPYYAVDNEKHLEASVIPSDNVNRPSEAEEVQEEEEEEEDDDDYFEDSGVHAVESDSISSRKLPEDDSRGASLYENDPYNDIGVYRHQAQDFQAEENDASSVARKLEQLAVEMDERRLPSEEYNTPSVVIPDHLQVQNIDCSHLSFGSFGSGMGAGHSSGTVKSVPVETNLEEPRSEADIPSVGHIDSRSSDYYVDDSLRNASDGGLYHRSSTSASARDYDPSSAPQQEELKPESAEGPHGSQYSFPPSNPGYAFDGSQNMNAPFSQKSSEMQSLAPYSDVMQSYTNALPSNLSPANVQPTRESDLQYSPFPVTQSMSAKFGTSVGGSTISMSEALKTAGFSLNAQNLPGSSIATGPPLPQHLVHPYTQPTLPLAHYPNMVGYPFLPQSYTYLPSAFQQAFAGNSSYHQSLAAVLPQYKNDVSASSLPQSAAIASGYGGFGSNASIPGNFPVNQPAAPSGSTLRYEDVLSSQYKENSHLLSLQQQQNENSAMWLHGHNSRTMPAVPASTYYNYQGQNQQSGGFRQAQQQQQQQQPSQNYGALGYPNFYHSQSIEQQQQNTRDGPQAQQQQQQQQQQPKQSQLWQNSY